MLNSNTYQLCDVSKPQAVGCLVTQIIIFMTLYQKDTKVLERSACLLMFSTKCFALIHYFLWVENQYLIEIWAKKVPNNNI